MTKFIIQRTTGTNGDSPPIEGAKLGPPVGESKNPEWYIEINTLDELLALVNRAQEEIIIMERGYGYEIEIYDGWRE